jgi:hypothetical protein
MDQARQPKAYAVQAQVVKTSVGLDGVTSTISYGIPTFYLFRSVQGIVCLDQAEKIVKSILNPTNDPSVVVHPNCVLVDVSAEFEED